MKIYADTSIFGGVFDEEFAHPSEELFRQVRDGRFSLITSPLVQAELEPAPKEVSSFFESFLDITTITPITAETLSLRDAYLAAGILTPKSANDALHVALAALAECRLIVSWNFKHIVHFEKIPRFNAVNVLHGYPQIGIYSPAEVIHYEN